MFEGLDADGKDSIMTQQSEVLRGGINISVLSATMREFTKTRSCISSYPQGHPVISRSSAKVAEMFASLFNGRDRLSIAVARDSLVVYADTLEQLVPATNALAATLSHYGIASVCFLKGIEINEIEKFAGMLLKKRTDIASCGGMARAVEGAGLAHVTVVMIEYDAFRTSDDFTEKLENRALSRLSLWQLFTHEILSGTAEQGSAHHACLTGVDPEQLAQLLNDASPESFERILGILKGVLDAIVKRAALKPDDGFYTSLAGLVGSLSKKSRGRLLEVVSDSFQGDEHLIEALLRHLPFSVMQEIRETSINGRAVLPSYVYDVMERLVECSPQKAEPSNADGMEISARDAAGNDLELMLREEDVESFVPSEYLETLKNLIEFEDIPAPEDEKLASIRRSLSSESVGYVLSRIIIESLGDASSDQITVFKGTLLGLMQGFLQSGDFNSLRKLFESLSSPPGAEFCAAVSLRKHIVDQFRTADFAQNVLDSLYVWGKPKFNEIGSLIQSIGEPFIEPLLDKLAEEESITLRRYYLDQLTPLAAQAKNAVLARLGDSRWYVLRNLITILQHADDPDVVNEFGTLASFPHPKVRQKVIETYLMFNCRAADRLLVQDLASADQEVRLQAIQMAEESRADEVVTRLLDIVGSKKLSPAAIDEKRAVIRVLAKIGDRRTLAVFDAILKRRHFFRAASQRVIKKEIVATLGAYRDSKAIALLEAMRKVSDAEIASLAAGIYSSVAKEHL